MVVYGIYYSLGMVAGAFAVTWLLSWPFGIPFYLLAAFCLWFFRDPERQIASGPVAVSPADGKVVLIIPDTAGGHRISIFLNVFNVHVNRTPIPGRIEKIEYKHGQFLVASKESASHSNEQNIFTVEGIVGGKRTRIVFSQIAGLIARRIICYKKVGDVLQPGERVGLIKFGSRVDIFLGSEWRVMVKVGDHVAGGSSVIARIDSAGEGNS
ncbi:MAG: phosphatidylserine decarboxylase [Bryobacteraceae bacterium]